MLTFCLYIFTNILNRLIQTQMALKFNCRPTSKKNISRYPSYAALQENRLYSEQKENLAQRLPNNQIRKQNFWKRKVYNQNNNQNVSNNLSLAQRNRRTHSTKVHPNNMSEFGQVMVSNPFQSIDKQLDGLHQLEKVLSPFEGKFRLILKHQKQHLKEAEIGIQEKSFKIGNYKVILDKLQKNLNKALQSPLFGSLNYLKDIFLNYIGVTKEFQDKLLNEVHELRQTRMLNPTEQYMKLQKEHNKVSEKLYEMSLYCHAIENYNNKNSKELQLLQDADKEKQKLIKKYKANVLQLQNINYNNFLAVEKNVYNKQENAQSMELLSQRVMESVLQSDNQTNLELFRSIDYIFIDNCLKNSKNLCIIETAKSQKNHKTYGFNTQILFQHINNNCDYNVLCFCQKILKTVVTEPKQQNIKTSLSLRQVLILLEKLTLQKFTSFQYQKKINTYLQILRDVHTDSHQTISPENLKSIQQYFGPESTKTKSNESTFYQPSIKNKRLINCMSLLQNRNNNNFSARSTHESSTQKLDSVMIEYAQVLGCIYYHLQNQFQQIKKDIYKKCQIQIKKGLSQIIQEYFRDKCIKQICVLPEKMKQQLNIMIDYCQRVSKYQQIKYFSVQIRYRTTQLLFDMFLKKEILVFMSEKIQRNWLF